MKNIIKPSRESKIVTNIASRISIKWLGPQAPVDSLSGGNQQKILIARWLLAESKFMIFDEPTRGIDVGAKKEVYSLLNELAEEGKAILFISSELPELFGIADRILVMRRGRFKLARQLLPFGSLILIICFLSALKPDTFLTADNFLNVLRRSSVNGIIAVGMTAIIISAGIDLSVGSMMALSGMVGAWVMILIGGTNPQGAALVLGTIVGIVTGITCGTLNGLLVTKLKLPPFIVTLGTMSTFRGISYVMNAGKPYNIPHYKYLNEGIVLGIPTF